MLVLSRKKGERIMIGDNITIVIVEVRGDKVRIGVEAPKDVPVHRDTVYEAIKRLAQQATSDENSDGQEHQEKVERKKRDGKKKLKEMIEAAKESIEIEEEYEKATQPPEESADE